MQLLAVRSQITNVSKVILKDHIDHCIVEAVRENNDRVIENLKGAIVGVILCSSYKPIFKRKN